MKFEIFIYVLIIQEWDVLFVDGHVYYSLLMRGAYSNRFVSSYEITLHWNKSGTFGFYGLDFQNSPVKLDSLNGFVEAWGNPDIVRSFQTVISH